MQATLTKNDIEDAVRRALDTHTRSPWYDTEAAAVYLSSTPKPRARGAATAAGRATTSSTGRRFDTTSPTSMPSFVGRTVDERFPHQ